MSENKQELDATLTHPLPELQANFTDSLQANVSVNPDTSSVMADNSGEAFNPEIHAVDENGEPKLTKTGKFRKKTGVKQNISSVGGFTSEAEHDVNVTAMQFVQINFMIGRRVGGEVGEPVVMKNEAGAEIYNEEKELFKHVKRYCEENDIKDFPPGITIALLMVPYWARVGSSYFQKNHSISLWQAIGVKIKGLFKGKKHATRTNSGTNPKREDNPSPEKSMEIS